MKPVLMAALASLSCLFTASAEELPSSLDKPFLGCWVGFAGSRDFEFAIGGDGDSELFFFKDKKRLITGGCSLKIYYTVQEEIKDKGGKTRWINRTMADDGFSEFDKETAEPAVGKPVSFTATYTGDIKVKIAHVFSKGGVEISTVVLDKGKAKGKLRAGVKVVVGDMFRHIKDEDLEERGTEEKLEDTKAAVLPVGERRGKRIKFKDYDKKQNLAEMFPKGASKFSLESDRIGEHEYELSTANPDYGVLEFTQKAELMHGFSVNWWADPKKVKEKDARLVIKVK